ncbi:MAG: FAD-binding protein [Burkholderiales bacterium]|nr:FAD-binding protein [Burkholderiales bacterium]
MSIPETVDVVVLGAGLAGHCAALSAAENGASVLLLEKADNFGGSTASGPGSFAFAATPLQKKLGIDDSLERLRRDLIDAGGGKAREDLIDAYVRLQLATYEWMVGLGFRFERVEASTYQSVPRSHPISGAHVVTVLHDRLLGCDKACFVADARGLRLERDTDGRVRRVAYQHGGDELRTAVNGGVVICTGGFARSDRLIEKFAPEFVNAVRMGGMANEGDGLLMAWALGADLIDTGWLSGTFGASLNHYPDLADRSGRGSILMHPIFKGGIAVNRHARRFADESGSYKITGRLCLEQPDAVAFQVFDQNTMDASVPGMMPRDFRAGFEKGLVRTAGTIAELAQTVGLDPDALEATVARYNGFVQAGHDPEFGRMHLIGAIGELTPIARAPFYIYPCTTALLSTYGGIAVDDQTRVLDVHGQAIAGLFAAGEVTGGLHGTAYLSGSSLAKAAIFGRLAGANAARAAR